MKLKVEENKPLSSVSTLKVGGNASYFATVRTQEELSEAFQLCKKDNIPYFILGKGSNIIFDDRGFRGMVIQNKIAYIESEKGLYKVGAGYSFSLLGAQTAKSGWGGLEFASGIPGSVGGAVFMNAGANGGETCDTLVSVDYVDNDGTMYTFKKDELEFRYRWSSFHEMQGAVTGAVFSLHQSEAARNRQLELVQYRKGTQPYGDASAGCAFRNPEGSSAGLLIDQCGLKGQSIGGAKVSEKHANFIINTGHAASEDILLLIAKIKKQVIEKTGIMLEQEIRFIPY